MKRLNLTLLALMLSLASFAVAPITGTPAMCASSSVVLADATTGGIWSSSNVAVAIVGSASGIVTGLTPGTAVITYDVSGSTATITVTVNASPSVITGPTTVCIGSAITDADGVAGGTWSISSSLASVTGAGVLTGVSAGTATLTYSLATGCVTTTSITVEPLPATYALTGGGSYCSGGSGVAIGLSGSTAGVSYQLYAGGTVIGSPILGTGSALSFGTVTAAGTYTVAATSAITGCTVFMTGSAIVSISPLPTVYSMTGGGSYCAGGAGSDIALDGSDIGVNYQLYLGSVAVGTSITGTGSAIDFGLETTAGTYAIEAINASTSCYSTMVGSAVVAISTPPTVTASATEASCGGTYTLTAGGATSYSWAPSTGLSCSTCSGPTSSGLAASATYTVTGTDGIGCTGTATATVNFNRVSGHITYTGVSTDVFRVWLIQFNPSDSSIIATDSTNSCMDAGIPYFEFASPAAGNYMVKAKLNGTVAGASGYMPTYSASTPNWYDAASITHATGADAANITMVYGTVPAGPGFISGYISAGAGRGTSGDVPAEGMMVYLKDASGHTLTYTTTDASGNYSFTSLGNGSYIIYPENYSFYTTPSSVITLSTSSETASGVNFKQHNTSGTITPNLVTTAVTSVSTEGFNVFPNPTTGNLNIQWSNKATGAAHVVIADVTGREMSKTTIDMNTTSGQAQLNLAGMNDGIYFISITSAGVNYSGKIVVQH